MEVCMLIGGFFFGSWAEFQFQLKAIQKLYMVKTKDPTAFRESKAQKYKRKKEKMQLHLMTDEEKINAENIRVAKINTCDSLKLFIRHCSGCFT